MGAWIWNKIRKELKNVKRLNWFIKFIKNSVEMMKLTSLKINQQATVKQKWSKKKKQKWTKSCVWGWAALILEGVNPGSWRTRWAALIQEGINPGSWGARWVALLKEGINPAIPCIMSSKVGCIVKGGHQPCHTLDHEEQGWLHCYWGASTLNHGEMQGGCVASAIGGHQHRIMLSRRVGCVQMLWKEGHTK